MSGVTVGAAIGCTSGVGEDSGATEQAVSATVSNIRKANTHNAECFPALA
jgi:hypothetical protein